MEWLTVGRRFHVGQTLIESVIALAIFSLLAVSLVSLILGGASSSLEGTEHTHADALAQEGLEASRSIRDRAWNELRYTSSGVSAVQKKWVFTGEGTWDIESPYSRQITVASVCRSLMGDIVTCPGNSTDLDTLYVTSSVSWKSSGGANLTRARSSYMTNWDSSVWTQTDWSGGPGQALWSNATQYDSDDANIDHSTNGQLSLASSSPTGTWSLVTSPISGDGIRAISALSASDIWAVGESGKIIHYNGTSWTENADVGSTTLFGISMVSSTDGWAVGSAGKIYHYNGTSWSEFLDVGSQNLNSISMLSSSYGWAVGGNGTIYRYNGATWSAVTSPVTQQLNAVQTLSTTNAWIGADSGKFLHYNGISWSVITDLGGNNVESLSMLSSTSGWGGGQNGEIYRYNGTSWSIFTDTGNEVWYGILARGPNDAWIVGAGGAIRRFNGSVWNVVSSPSTHDLHAITLLTDQNGWAAGQEGDILHYVAGTSGYVTDGSMVSSAFSLTDASPVQYLAWDQAVPLCTPLCYIRFQIRSAPDAGGVPGVYTPWYGSSGAASYFTQAAGTLAPIELNGNQWVQYRAELHGDGAHTPTLQEVRVNYK